MYCWWTVAEEGSRVLPACPAILMCAGAGSGAGARKPLGAAQVARAPVAAKVISLQTGPWELFPKAAAFVVFSKPYEQSGGL